MLQSKTASPLVSVASDATVTYAVCLMNHHGIGAVLVMDGGKLAGIFTERDVLRRVIEPGLDPRITRVGEVHTAEPRTIAADARATDALDLMVAGNFRHLPVVGNGAVQGTLSMRDLTEWLIRKP
ncbi:MAG: CBS domain-containing protein [Casimicrobiaceae bacterium]